MAKISKLLVLLSLIILSFQKDAPLKIVETVNNVS
jgi:hypothetical protein